MALFPGTKLGRYEISSKIGEGGMGEVYLARDTQLDRAVAVKVLPAEIAADAQRLHRFMQEARAASKLKSANVAHIYEIGESEGLRFIAMEYVEGEPLQEKIEGQPMNSTEIVRISMQITRALDEAHSKGITHRDIKPSNIMITPRGQAKLLDFGLAKVRRSIQEEGSGDATTQLKTAEGIVIGTVMYMSPEQALGQVVDHRSDIFSLGAVLYEMATGKLPFAGSMTTEIIDRIVHSQPEAISRFNYDVPAELERVIRKCLEKDKERRYQSARDLLVDLDNVKRDSAVKPVVSEDKAPVRHKQLQLGIVAALALLIVGLVGLGIYLLNHRNRSTAAPIDSIAVLPFANTNGDPNTEYFSDGITESIISKLSQLSQLRVVARSTVFRYKGKDVNPQRVGNDLGVRAVLMGRVIQQGDNLTIRTELVNVSDGSELWGQQYNRKLSDAFEVQEEIAKAISGNLRLKLSGAEQGRLTKRYTENPEAYQLYLRGRYFWNKRSEEGINKGIEYFQQAIAKDPNYALAYTGLADSYSHLVFPVDAVAPTEAMPRAKEAALQALAIDNTLEEAHAALGFVKYYYDWDWSGAETEFKRAIELNPSYAEAHHYYSHYLISVGRTDESLAESLRCLELEPSNPLVNVHLGWHYLYARQYDRAVEQLQKTLEMDPNFAQTNHWLGLVYEQQAKYPEAIATLQKALTLFGESTQTRAELAHAYAVSGKKDEARKIIATLQETAKRKYVSSYEIAAVYAALDEKDQAFEWLEKAFAERSGSLVNVRVDQRFDSLRSDPRFASLVRRVKLPQ